ncbi:ribonuclease T2 family protein [Tsuneonella mangrovi]|uniref:ribonuclease T2 family protein n=1 Tax=Tsuneonella mangrovi TaxID=1982042 RepID=UPI001F0A998B|nr:ribonuclease T [Tsuneonella mangrovi]
MLIALALLALPVPALAQAYQCRVPQSVSVPQVHPDGPTRRVPVAGYTLALSWSPEFCKPRKSSARDAMQCSGRNGLFGLVVHGLWPEGRGTWPQWCPTPRKLAPSEVRRNLCMMPSARVQANEWAKHGACMIRTPEGYFEVTRILWEGLRKPDLDRLSRDPDLTAGKLRDAFTLANPDWPRSAVGIVLNRRGWLQELRLCYAKDFMPTTCDRRRFGPNDAVKVKIWRGL